MLFSVDYLTIGLFASLMIGFMIFGIILWKLLASGGKLSIFNKRATVPQPYRYVGYECGEVPIGKTRFSFDIEYYIFPLIFIVFDVFTPFLFLWSVSYSPNNVLINGFFVLLILFLFLGMMMAVLRDGKKLVTPDYQTDEYLDMIDRAANGDEEALSEFLRIEPLTIIKKEPEIKPISQDLAKKYDITLPNQKTNPIQLILRKALGWLFNWGLGKSPWILYLGIKCCALEIPMAVGVSRFDMERWGIIPSGSPRQVDLVIINGPITFKWAPRIKALYDQMAEPKFVVALGECAIIGGPFKGSYSVIDGVNKVIPVDFYLPGCPPRPEMFLDLAMKYRSSVPREVEERRKRIMLARKEVLSRVEKALLG